MGRTILITVNFFLLHLSVIAQVNLPAHFHPQIPPHVLPLKVKPRQTQDLPGDSRFFFVRNVQDQSKWRETRFLLYLKTPDIHYWIDTASVFKKTTVAVLDSILAVFNQRMSVSTFPSSLDSSLGILPLETRFIGELPDIDGDQILDVLLLDIDDGFEVSGQFVAGFFDPVDQLDFKFSNRKDILYLDIWPTIIQPDQISIEQGAQTMAHELQHLIHSQFMTFENQEWVSINEGCSEFTEYLCGFSPRPLFRFPGRIQDGWAFWKDDQAILSYEKSAAFISWFYFRFGLKALQNLVHSRESGFNGIREALEKSGSSVPVQDLQRMFAEDWVRGGFLEPSRHQVFPENWQKDSRFTAQDILNTFPAWARSTLTKGGFFALKLQFSPDYELDWEADGTLSAGLLHRSASGEINWVQGLVPPVRITAESASDDYFLVVSNSALPVSETDENPVTVSVSVKGREVAGTSRIQLDDGEPDPFFGNAIFLKTPDSTLAFAFYLTDSVEFQGIREISLLTGFLSEFEGTGVGSLEARNFELEFRKNLTEPGFPVIPLSSNREFARLRFETHRIPDSHPAYHFSGTGIWVLVWQTKGTRNPVALGIDHSGNTAFRMVTRENEVLEPSAVFNPLYNLTGKHPMIRVGVMREKEPPVSPDEAPVFSLGNDTLRIQFGINRPDSGSIVSLTRYSAAGRSDFSLSAGSGNGSISLSGWTTGFTSSVLSWKSDGIEFNSPFSTTLFTGKTSDVTGWMPGLNGIKFTAKSVSASFTDPWGFISVPDLNSVVLIPVLQADGSFNTELHLPDGVALTGSGTVFFGNGNWGWDLKQPLKLNKANSENTGSSTVVIRTGNPYPNPSRSDFQLLVTTNRSDQIPWEVYSVTGQKILCGTWNLKPGSQITPVSLAGFSTGIYFLRLKTNGGFLTHKLLILK